MKARTLLWVLLGITGGLLFFWLFPLKLVSRLAARFGKSAPCPASLAWLVDNPIRRRYLRSVLNRVGIRPHERVLELGPGPGIMTVEAARHAGPEGQLIAVDIQPEMIAQVKKRVEEAGLTNVETHIADAYHLPLDDASVDRAFLVSVLPEITDRARALAELHRVIEPGGLLSITEEFVDPDYLFPFETTRLVEAADFRFERRFGNLLLYTLNFRRET
ncbi:MAG: methyltransferase domain-containing protein [Anaerolineae bacterium]|nr:methyltransferase domain-containing protein [Anaerolineae bacterium]